MNTARLNQGTPLLLNAVSKHYAENIVLNQLDLHIPAGQFVAVVGRSGGGKSTLLRLLAGLEKPTKGEVIIDGQHIENLKEDQLVRFRREKVGFIFQSFQLLGSMNALENVALEFPRCAESPTPEKSG